MSRERTHELPGPADRAASFRELEALSGDLALLEALDALTGEEARAMEDALDDLAVLLTAGPQDSGSPAGAGVLIRTLRNDIDLAFARLCVRPVGPDGGR